MSIFGSEGARACGKHASSSAYREDAAVLVDLLTGRLRVYGGAAEWETGSNVC